MRLGLQISSGVYGSTLDYSHWMTPAHLLSFKSAYLVKMITNIFNVSRYKKVCLKVLTAGTHQLAMPSVRAHFSSTKGN